MRYRVGLDLGSTYTKIAYVDPAGTLHLFRYPRGAGTGYIPTAIAYRGTEDRQVLSIGDAARVDGMAHCGVRLCDNFKALLPLGTRDQWETHGWSSDHSPGAVAQDYLLRLLLEGPDSFVAGVGPIEGLVLSIPARWHCTPDHRGPIIVRHLVRNELSLPLIQLWSEPICATAYFAHRYRHKNRRPFNGTLLVCDAGGGSFSAALCRIADQRIEMVDVESSDPPGSGRAGRAFDFSAAALAYAAAHGEEPDASRPEFREVLRGFEAAKIQEHRQTVRLLALQSQVPELSDTPIYVFQGRYQLRSDQLQVAFQPIAGGISSVLSSLLRRTRERSLHAEGVAIVGGFAQLPFVQQTIRTSLEGAAQEPSFGVTILENEAGMGAVAYGSALIANGMFEPVDDTPHTIGIFARRRKSGALGETFLPFVDKAPGSAEQGHSYVLEDEVGKPLAIRVEREQCAPLPLYMRMHGSGEPVAVHVPAVEYPPVGSYHLTLVIDRSHQASVTFTSVETGVEQVYRLGALRFNLKGERTHEYSAGQAESLIDRPE